MRSQQSQKSNPSLFDTLDQMGLIASDLKNKGIERAENNANEKIDKWSDKAYSALCDFLNELGSGKSFKVEDFRTWCIDRVPEPPSKRAFGAIILRAAKAKLVHKTGHATVNNPTAHRCFASVWTVN